MAEERLWLLPAAVPRWHYEHLCRQCQGGTMLLFYYSSGHMGEKINKKSQGLRFAPAWPILRDFLYSLPLQHTNSANFFVYSCYLVGWPKTSLSFIILAPADPFLFNFVKIQVAPNPRNAKMILTQHFESCKTISKHETI